MCISLWLGSFPATRCTRVARSVQYSGAGYALILEVSYLNIFQINYLISVYIYIVVQPFSQFLERNWLLPLL